MRGGTIQAHPWTIAMLGIMGRGLLMQRRRLLAWKGTKVLPALAANINFEHEQRSLIQKEPKEISARNLTRLVFVNLPDNISRVLFI